MDKQIGLKCATFRDQRIHVYSKQSPELSPIIRLDEDRGLFYSEAKRSMADMYAVPYMWYVGSIAYRQNLSAWYMSIIPAIA